MLTNKKQKTNNPTTTNTNTKSYNEYLSNKNNLNNRENNENNKTTINNYIHNNNKTDFSKLYKIINYKFKNESLIREAFTRQSAIGERNPEASEKNYQRFEFFGDSLLNLVMTELVFEVFPERTEEYLTPWRSDIVKNETLACLAKELCLGQFLILGKGEEKQNSRKNKHILADIVEALIAAVYFDTEKDYVKTKAVTLDLFKEVILNLFELKSKNEICKVRNFLKQNNVRLDNLRKLNSNGLNGLKLSGEDSELMFIPKKLRNGEIKSASNNDSGCIVDNRNINFLSFGENENNNNNNNNNDGDNIKRSLLSKTQNNNSCNNDSAKRSCESSLTDNSTHHSLSDNFSCAKNNNTNINNNINNSSIEKTTSKSKNKSNLNNSKQNTSSLNNLLKNLKSNLISNNEILNLDQYLPDITEKAAFPFHTEYLVRIIHETPSENEKENELNYNLSLNKANFKSKLKNLEIKNLFASTKYLLSVSFLENFEESLTDFATGKVFYYKCQGLFLQGYYEDVLEEIELCLNSIKKVKNDAKEIEAEARLIYLNALMLKLNSKLKIIEERSKMEKFCEKFEKGKSVFCVNYNVSGSFNCRNNCKQCAKKNEAEKIMISKYDLEEIIEISKKHFFSSNTESSDLEFLELKFFLTTLKIKFYFYEFENSDSLFNQEDQIEQEIRELEAILTKIFMENQRINLTENADNALLTNQLLFEYANIKTIEIKIKHRKSLDGHVIAELKESIHSFIIPGGNIEASNKLDLIFLPVMFFEFENFIENWSNENLEQLSEFSFLLELVFRTVISHFGFFSRVFECVYYEANKIRENLLLIEDEEEQEDFCDE